MLYECDLNGIPVSCTILEWDNIVGKCLIEYQDPIGLLRLWVNSDTIRPNLVHLETSQ